MPSASSSAKLLSISADSRVKNLESNIPSVALETISCSSSEPWTLAGILLYISVSNCEPLLAALPTKPPIA